MGYSQVVYSSIILYVQFTNQFTSIHEYLCTAAAVQNTTFATYTRGLYKRTENAPKSLQEPYLLECGGIRGANAQISFNLQSLFYMF